MWRMCGQRSAPPALQADPDSSLRPSISLIILITPHGGSPRRRSSILEDPQPDSISNYNRVTRIQNTVAVMLEARYLNIHNLIAFVTPQSSKMIQNTVAVMLEARSLNIHNMAALVTLQPSNRGSEYCISHVRSSIHEHPQPDSISNTTAE
ncbi:hypothetical protein J6590_051856 [Homalodisca vitripennis]|nr:hypothetical protein J6590_051856 [Homalodisca vitripennis]